MYKSIMGWKEDDLKHETTHVLLENGEYRELYDELDRKQDSYKKSLQTLINEHKVELAKMQNTVKDALEAAEHERNLNVYLKEILREKSNAARKLTPRKEREGYVVLSSREIEYRYRNKFVKVWRSRIQTMYDSSIPLQVCEQELFEGFTTLAKGCGITQMIPDYDPELTDYCFKLSYTANFRSQFWEIDVLHPNELKIIREYMP